MSVHGNNLIGQDRSATGSQTFQPFNPREEKANGSRFHEADASEINRALDLAEQAASELRWRSADEISAFLLAVRQQIVDLGEALIETADRETALGPDRLRGERDRTVNQIKLFADLAAEGSWVDAVIDTALPDRKPIPRPDLRRMLIPVGPVAVFGASNFPLAFSVAGGDTVSAFAARNPVIVKAHPAHPETSELVGDAIVRAVRQQAFPSGTFSLLHGSHPEPSVALVQHPKTKAVAFTGSLRAGRALFDAAAKRPSPIPVFAEMGSVNPVFILRESLKTGAHDLAEGLFRSVTLGVGQLCTCPGLVFAVEAEALGHLTGRLTELFAESAPGIMLNSAIAKNYREGITRAAEVPGVTVQKSSRLDASEGKGSPNLLQVDAGTWLRRHELHEEIFGPSTLIVRCASEGEMLDCARALAGTLTATVHAAPGEITAHSELVSTLADKAGRLIFNGYPTGVDVGYAMQHGGPYPSTTDARFTSVGARAILRFARPVCFQGFPGAQLPPELQDENPRGIWRTVNGKLSREAL